MSEHRISINKWMKVECVIIFNFSIAKRQNNYYEPNFLNNLLCICIQKRARTPSKSTLRLISHEIPTECIGIHNANSPSNSNNRTKSTKAFSNSRFGFDFLFVCSGTLCRIFPWSWKTVSLMTQPHFILLFNGLLILFYCSNGSGEKKNGKNNFRFFIWLTTVVCHCHSVEHLVI